VTHRAYMALEASGFSGRGRRWAMGCCDVTEARMGVQGRFLDASGLTQQPKYNLFRVQSCTV